MSGLASPPSQISGHRSRIAFFNMLFTGRPHLAFGRVHCLQSGHTPKMRDHTCFVTDNKYYFDGSNRVGTDGTVRFSIFHLAFVICYFLRISAILTDDLMNGRRQMTNDKWKIENGK